MNDLIDHAAELIAQAGMVVVTAGAGIGVDSGLPDFRGNEGFWKAYPALGQAGLRFSEIADPSAFDTTPRLAWGFYGHRLNLYRRTMPHAGFAILRRWQSQADKPGPVFTSNVDGQFQRAGFDPSTVVECHGSIHHLQCSVPCGPAIWSADTLEVDIDTETCQWVGELPRCPNCGALARPNILMFGDPDWLEHRTEAQRRNLVNLLVRAERPVVIEVGAGSDIPTVRQFGQSVVTQHGGRMVRINPREAKVPLRQDVGLEMGALAALVAIDARLQSG